MLKASMRVLLACSAGGLVSWAAAGCTRLYQVAGSDYAAAYAPGQTDRSRRQLALVAEPLDQGPEVNPVYLRASNLEPVTAGSGQGSRQPVRVQAPDSQAYQITGRVLFSLGMVHLGALTSVMLFDFLPRDCGPVYSCQSGIPASAVYGGPLAAVFVGLTIPGIILMVKGYRYPSEVPTGRRDLRYLGVASP